MSRPGLLLVVLLFLPAAQSFSADRQVAMPDYVQEIWDSKDDALPHPGVTSILQTRDGYLWLGTFTGLARFDGVRFHLPGAGQVPALSDHVRCLAEGADGSLWVGTRREGLVRLKGGDISVLTARDGLHVKDIRALAATPDGTVWIGTASGVLARRADGTMQTIGAELGLPNETVQTLFVDHDGTLWVGTSEYGLAYWDGTRLRTVDLSIGSEVAATTGTINIAARAVLAIGRGTDGTFYVGTSVGLFRVAGERTPTTTRTRLVSEPAYVVSGASRGTLWASIATGLARVDERGVTRYSARDGLLHDNVMAVYEDAEKSLWLGTRVGLARLRRRSITTLSERDGLPSNSVIAVLEARNGDLWVGTRSGLAQRRGGAWATFDTRHGLPSPTIRSLGEAPDATIWVGTVNGVARFDEGRGRFIAYPRLETPYPVRAIAFDEEGRPWLGSFEGIDRLEDGKITRFIARTKFCHGAGPYYLLQRPGVLWVGGSNTLAQVRGREQLCYVDKEVASRNDVRHLYVDVEGVLWIGSIGGLSRWVDGRRDSLKGPAGPFNTAIYGILDDDRGSMWVNTPKGLFEIVKKDIDRYADASAAPTLYHAYGVSDGMDSSVGTGDGQPSAWRGRDGRLYFTTASGLAVVDPSQIEHSTQVPPVYVDRLRANRQAIDLRGERRLDPGTRDVEIEFTALSFVAPERVTYRYMLEGFDASWVDIGARRTAYYTNLPPRKYRFRVKAASPSGVWNEQGATVDFEILPRVYQRAWFVPFVAAVVLLAAASAYRMRVAAHRAREKELQQAVREAVASVQVLRGMLPVCASCRRVKQDSGAWRQIEAYVMEHTEATFSHTMCDECYAKMRDADPNLPELGKLQS